MLKAIGLIAVGFVCYFAYKNGLVDAVKAKLSKLLPR